MHYLTNRCSALGIATFVLSTLAYVVPVGAKADTLVYANHLPPNHYSTLGVEAFADQVKHDTDGRVTFQINAGGSLVEGRNTLESIQNGLIDSGHLISQYTRAAVPATSLLGDYNLINTDVLVGAAAVTDTILNDCPQCLSEFKRHNVHVLSSFASPPYQLMCASSFPNGIDLAGKRIRAVSGEDALFFTSIGAVPVEIPNSESYQALQRHQLDCDHGVFSWLQLLSLNEVVKTAIKMPLGAYQGGILLDVSESAWQKISVEDRKAMIHAAPIGLARTTFIYLDKEVTSDPKVKFVDAPADLVAKRDAFKAEQRARLVQKGLKSGVKDPDQLLAKLEKNFEKWHSLIDPQPPTEEEYVTLLRKEIYSKVQP